MNKIVKKDYLLEDEEVKLEEEVEIVEEYLDVSNDLLALEKDKDLIRMEMNIIEYPVFSKNKRIKKNQVMKYHFKSDGSSYLEVAPKVNSKIPGEFCERVFIALTKIMRNNNFGRTFNVTATEIIKNLGNVGKTKNIYSRIDDALNRLTETHYQFANSLYSNEQKSIVDAVVKTTIMNIKVITLKDATDEEKEFFIDNRIKRVYQVSFTDYFYKNIIQKGYLVFDADALLKISDSITRSIYTMITKWRNNKLYLKRTIFSIARRIPIKWDKRNLTQTIKRVKKSCEELKEFKYISDFNIIKKDKWDSAEIEFFFDEEHNKVKQQLFYQDKSDFDERYIIHVEDRLIEDKEVLEHDVQEIIDLFPLRAKKLKTLSKSIKTYLRQHSFEYVKYAAEYTCINCKVSFLKYFKDVVENNWHEEYMVNKIDKPKEIIKAVEIIDEPKEIIKPVANNYEEWLIDNGLSDTVLNKNIFEKTVTNKRNKNLIEVKKEYKDITELIFDLMTELDKLNIKLDENLILIINTLKKYKGVLGEIYLELEFIESGMSYFKIGGNK